MKFASAFSLTLLHFASDIDSASISCRSRSQGFLDVPSKWLHRRMDESLSFPFIDLPIDLDLSDQSSKSLHKRMDESLSFPFMDLPIDLDLSDQSSKSLHKRMDESLSFPFMDLPIDLDLSDQSQ